MSSIKCRFCQTPLHHMFCNLGTSPLSNTYLKNSQLLLPEPFYRLHAYVCSKCFLVQLTSQHHPAEIFSDYAYFSSYSTSWLEHCQRYAQMAIERFKLNLSSQVIEIASNDGYLLQFFKKENIPVLGIEPARNIAQVAIAKGIPTSITFFSLKYAQQNCGLADLLIGNNVLAHVPDLNDFVAGLQLMLKPQGILTMEFPSLLKLIEHTQFDTIYHEHYSYFSLLTVIKVFAAYGLEIFDVERLSTHGGSLRIFAKHVNDKTKEVSKRVSESTKEELDASLDSLKTYVAFDQKAEKIKRDLLAFLNYVRNENKTIAAYGAPAKGNTLLNYCGISAKDILFTVDLNIYKQGRFLPGSHIPIFAPEKLQEERPNYLLILPWNLKEEIVLQTSYIKEWGGKFVIPIPELHVFG